MSRKQAFWVLSLVSIILANPLLPTLIDSFDKNIWKFSFLSFAPGVLVYMAISVTWLVFVANRAARVATKFNSPAISATLGTAIGGIGLSILIPALQRLETPRV